MNFNNSTFVHIRNQYGAVEIHARSFWCNVSIVWRLHHSGMNPLAHSLLLGQWLKQYGKRRESDTRTPTVYVFFDGDPAMDTTPFLQVFQRITMVPFIIGPTRQPDLIVGLLRRDVELTTKKSVLRELNEAQLACQLMIAFHECGPVLDYNLPKFQAIVDLWEEVHQV